MCAFLCRNTAADSRIVDYTKFQNILIIFQGLNSEIHRLAALPGDQLHMTFLPFTELRWWWGSVYDLPSCLRTAELLKQMKRTMSNCTIMQVLFWAFHIFNGQVQKHCSQISQIRLHWHRHKTPYSVLYPLGTLWFSALRRFVVLNLRGE